MRRVQSMIWKMPDEIGKEIFGMQQNNFNDIRIDTGKKIKKIFFFEKYVGNINLKFNILM